MQSENWPVRMEEMEVNVDDSLDVEETNSPGPLRRMNIYGSPDASRLNQNAIEEERESTSLAVLSAESDSVVSLKIVKFTVYSSSLALVTLKFSLHLDLFLQEYMQSKKDSEICWLSVKKCRVGML